MRRISEQISILALASTLAGPAVAGEVVQIRISDLAFTPVNVKVHVGDTVEWINADFVDHTATARTGDWDIAIAAGKSARVQVMQVGVISYFCRFHPQMSGTIEALKH